MKKYLFDTYKSMADKITPVLKSNNFEETGMLTPEEFVMAGDYLTDKYQTWSWARVSKLKAVSYLPANKQMLEMKNVFIQNNEEILKIDDNNEITILNSQNNESDIDFICDLEEEMEIDDEATLSNNIDYRKSYDINITYDNYFRSARIWFLGYDEFSFPLSYKKVLKDISPEHNKITVTIDPHPYQELNFINVHPCKHSHMMKRMIELEKNNHNTIIPVEQYFIYFLKFISCVIPNLEFDFTTST